MSDKRVVRGEKTEHALLRAATVEFARHGVDGVNIRTIAKRAKANSALIRYHFGSKQDLYDRVVRDAMRALKDRMVDAINDAESGPLHRRLVVALVGFLEEERDVQRIVSRAMVEEEARVVQIVDEELGSVFGAAKHALALFGVARRAEMLDGIISVLGAVLVSTTYAPIVRLLSGEDLRSDAARERRLAHLVALCESVFAQWSAAIR